MSLPWFRMYSEFAGDPVIQSLAFEDQRHYIILLCLKCSGALDRNVSREQRERIIFRGLGLDTLAGSEAKRRLMEVCLIADDWQPNGWDKRQFVSDKSTDRVRKYRNNKESRNVSETFLKRTRTDTDTDTDTEQIQTITPLSSDARPLPDAIKIFSHWQTKLNHPHAKLSPERQRRIKLALKNYSASQLCLAIDGCSVTPHNMGHNDRNEVYDDICLILRDASHIERFMRNAVSPPKPNGGGQPKPGKIHRAIEALRRSHELTNPAITDAGGTRTGENAGSPARSRTDGG